LHFLSASAYRKHDDLPRQAQDKQTHETLKQKDDDGFLSLRISETTSCGDPPSPLNKTLPNVLIIGDSISAGDGAHGTYGPGKQGWHGGYAGGMQMVFWFTFMQQSSFYQDRLGIDMGKLNREHCVMQESSSC
jgi:hypothetical protein